MALDSAGSLYYIPSNSDYSQSNEICKVEPSGKKTIIGTVPDVCNFTGDSLIENMFIDSNDNIYFVVKKYNDGFNYQILKRDKHGNTIPYSGNCLINDESVSYENPYLQNSVFPIDMAIDGENSIYISSVKNHTVWKMSKSSSEQSHDGIVFAEEGYKYIFDKTGRHMKTVDLDTGALIYEFGYDQNTGELYSIKNRFGQYITLNRSNGSMTITSPDRQITTLIIDSGDHLTDVIYPDNSNYHFVYTVGGLMTDMTDPNDNKFKHVFDNDIGRIKDVFDYKGGQIYGSWHYDKQTLSDNTYLTTVRTGEGNVTEYFDYFLTTGDYRSKIYDPSGGQTDYYESADGLTISKTIPCGMSIDIDLDMDEVLKFNYIKHMKQSTGGLVREMSRERSYSDADSDGKIDFVTDLITTNNKTAMVKKDTVQSIVEVETPEGRIVSFYYDPVTLQTTSTSISGINGFNYWYDAKGRPYSIKSGDRTLDVSYSPDSEIIDRTATVSDGMDTTIYHYDIMDRLRRIEQSDGTNVYLDYDAIGNMEKLRTPKWDDMNTLIDHLFDFNEVNLFGSYNTPNAGDEDYIYDYDKDRVLKSVTYPSGKQVVFGRAYNRLELITTPEGIIDYEWLCSTKLGYIERGTERITFGYDLNGYNSTFVTSETMTGTLNQTITYGYNDDFLMSSLGYAGAADSLGYDNDGLLTGIGPYTIIRKPENGLPESVAGNVLSIGRTFTQYGETDTETVKVSNSQKYSIDLDYDNQGRISSKTEITGSTKKKYVYTYEYGRLHYVDLYINDSTTAERVEVYEYYYNGARKSEINHYKGITTKKMFTYADDDRMMSARDGNISFGYNLDGFQETKTSAEGVTHYTYSTLGELTKVILPDGETIEYTYDPYGRRIERKVNGTITDKYLWMGQTTLLAIYDGEDKLKYRFEYADSRMPVSVTNGDNYRYYLAYDQVGSLRMVIDEAGDPQRTIEYDSFGAVTIDNNHTLDIPFGFAGGLYDYDTRLCLFGYRDYDTETGRWMAKDPILFGGGDTNLYGYCINDPVNWVDEDGLSKGGKQRIGGNNPLVDGIGKKSPKSQVDAAIKNITKQLKNPAISSAEKDYLRGWLKVAKRGFKAGFLIGIFAELAFPDDLNAEELDMLLKYYEEGVLPCN